MAYLGDGVGLAVVDNGGGRRAEGGEGGHDLGGVDGAVGPGRRTSHEGGGSSCDGGETHFGWVLDCVLRVVEGRFDEGSWLE